MKSQIEARAVDLAIRGGILTAHQMDASDLAQIARADLTSRPFKVVFSGLAVSQTGQKDLNNFLTLYSTALPGEIISAGVEESDLVILFDSLPEEASLDDDDDEYDDYEDEDEDIEGGDDLEGEEDIEEDKPAKPREPEEFKVLVTPEMHRVATKLFGSLGDSGSMARYGLFLKDFDSLLESYGGLQAKPRKTDEETSPDNNTADLAYLNDFVEASLEEARKGGKKSFKEGRSGLLSALMKAISGDAGDAIINEWDNMNVDALKEKLNKAVDKVGSILQEFYDKKHGKKDSPEEESASGPKPAYISRDMVVSPEFKSWIKSIGLSNVVPDHELHVTIAYSKKPVNWDNVSLHNISLLLPEDNERKLEYFGDSLVLVLNSDELQKQWEQHKGEGFEFTYPSYRPHISLNHLREIPEDQLPNLLAFSGSILLEEEKLQEIKEEYDPHKIEHIPVDDSYAS